MFSASSSLTQQQIDAAIDQAAARHNVDPVWCARFVKVESNFRPQRTVSRAAAMELVQLIPAGPARSLNVVDPFDPQQEAWMRRPATSSA